MDCLIHSELMTPCFTQINPAPEVPWILGDRQEKGSGAVVSQLCIVLSYTSVVVKGRQVVINVEMSIFLLDALQIHQHVCVLAIPREVIKLRTDDLRLLRVGTIGGIKSTTTRRRLSTTKRERKEAGDRQEQPQLALHKSREVGNAMIKMKVIIICIASTLCAGRAIYLEI